MPQPVPLSYHLPAVHAALIPEHRGLHIAGTILRG